ncbi:ACP S-malonyltransferase [Mariniplasma anaerobium]|uniref:Malonyl CoA-acyl carrier protein transacylase n=1 Tax=Mariniplasma anaerobium TaxID=2735436 RepID=A0A7U9XUP0_9MOLU|nr:ACP S-malonyltransferase [Mariniplasma anaerobium]BCR36300.1 malonyl CoA-acyl carrier protein transacylase [Mariniplasma anaerobium]
MNKLAICFSGQGSQYQNMGLDYIESLKTYEDMANIASNILGFNVCDVLKDEKLINQTKYTQPLVALKSIFGYDMISKLNPNVQALLGFSLGEYSAYYASKVFDFEQLLVIIAKRAEFMDQDAQKTKGLMAAVIGLEKDQVKSVCLSLQDQGVIDIANDNSPNQYVISGEEALVLKAISLLKEAGARRVIELKTSGAFHTNLMESASKKLILEMNNNPKLTPSKSNIAIYMNLDAKVLNDEDILKHIEKQMINEVKFRESILNMKKDGITHILEIGPGKVLTNLIKKIEPEIEVINFDQIESYETVKGWLKIHGFTK